MKGPKGSETFHYEKRSHTRQSIDFAEVHANRDSDADGMDGHTNDHRNADVALLNYDYSNSTDEGMDLKVAEGRLNFEAKQGMMSSKLQPVMASGKDSKTSKTGSKQAVAKKSKGAKSKGPKSKGAKSKGGKKKSAKSKAKKSKSKGKKK